MLLPLQTDPVLSSLYRTPKIHRTLRQQAEREIFHIPTVIPARNLVSHRRPHARIALFPRQDHPPHHHSTKHPAQRAQARRSSRNPHLSPGFSRCKMHSCIPALTDTHAHSHRNVKRSRDLCVRVWSTKTPDCNRSV